MNEMQNHISPHKNSIKLKKYISPQFQHSAFLTLHTFNTPHFQHSGTPFQRTGRLYTSFQRTGRLSRLKKKLSDYKKRTLGNVMHGVVYKQVTQCSIFNTSCSRKACQICVSNSKVKWEEP